MNVDVPHNDIFTSNVLVNDGQVTALLDWEEGDVDCMVWDLAPSTRADELTVGVSGDRKPLAVGMLEC